MVQLNLREVRRLHVHRACCSVVLRLSTCFPFSLGQIVQGESVLPCNGREAAASATRRCVCSVERAAGFCSKVCLQQRSEPCDKWKLIKQSPVQSTSSAWRQRGGCSVGHVEAGEFLSSNSEGERPPSQEAPQEGAIHAHRRNLHRDQHERDPALKREPEIAPKRRAILARILPGVFCLTCPHSSSSGGNNTKHRLAGGEPIRARMLR